MMVHVYVLADAHGGGADDGLSVQQLQLLPLWCAVGSRWPVTVVAVLCCAAALSARLQAALAEAAGGDAATSNQRSGFLEDLRAHLHRGATAQVSCVPWVCSCCHAVIRPSIVSL